MQAFKNAQPSFLIYWQWVPITKSPLFLRTNICFFCFQSFNCEILYIVRRVVGCTVINTLFFWVKNKYMQKNTHKHTKKREVSLLSDIEVIHSIIYACLFFVFFCLFVFYFGFVFAFLKASKHKKKKPK